MAVSLIDFDQTTVKLSPLQQIPLNLPKKVIPDALFLGSYYGTHVFNMEFINHYRTEGLPFASPRIFRHTSPASFAGYIAQTYNKPLQTTVFADHLWPLWSAIMHLKKYPDKKVIYYTIEYEPATYELQTNYLLLTGRAHGKLKITNMQYLGLADDLHRFFLKGIDNPYAFLLVDIPPGPLSIIEKLIPANSSVQLMSRYPYTPVAEILRYVSNKKYPATTILIADRYDRLWLATVLS